MTLKTEKAKVKKVKAEKFGFEAEVSKLLHMMVHSVYSDKEIFLRELISNASDACDKLRYEGQINADLLKEGGDYKIDITVDDKAGTLTISDNGIGMNKEDLISNLGTIARSGTSKFMEELGEDSGDTNLIGQFGVGFYSVFMVADKVSVISKKAGEAQAYAWVSDGIGEYTIAKEKTAPRGTSITLTLKKEAAEFLLNHTLRRIIKTYSDHITLPIMLFVPTEPKEGDDTVQEAEKINDGTAIWARQKSDITADQYNEFYRSVGQAFDEPAQTIHYKAEGMTEYSVLMYVPSDAPVDLFDPARRPKVKLYVKRVFITDDCEDLLPGYLRFMRGVVDSEDLPLNISREMLQNNAVMNNMKKAVTNRLLSEFSKLAKKDTKAYNKFWVTFGAVLKEGIYEDFTRRDEILKLARFESTLDKGLVSFDEYISRMKKDGKHIYYITGENAEKVKRSPQLEGFKSKGIEVLFLTDPVDDFWLQMVNQYDDKILQSVTRGSADLDEAENDKDKKEDKNPEIEALLNILKVNLGTEIKDARLSKRLTTSAVCLVADDGDMDMHMERILKMHKMEEAQNSSRILEINPDNALIKALAKSAVKEGSVEALKDASLLLLDQAKILEGELPEDVTAFTARLAKIMQSAF